MNKYLRPSFADYNEAKRTPNVANHKMATVEELTVYNVEKNRQTNCGMELDGYS